MPAIAVGNAYDYVNVGAMARVGINLPDDFGPPRLEPSLPGSSFFEPNGALSFYAFAGVDGPRRGAQPFPRRQQLRGQPERRQEDPGGRPADRLAAQLGGARLSFTHVFRSKEFKTQASADQFGAANVTFRL